MTERRAAYRIASDDKSPSERLHFQLHAAGVPEHVKEFRFDDTRRWRFDLAWPQFRLAVEVEGGTWVNGRHTRGSGFEKDCEKYNAAALAGWFVLRFTTGMIDSGAALATIKRAIEIYG
jgi:very-short-patch-repair endonuclease